MISIVHESCIFVHEQSQSRYEISCSATSQAVNVGQTVDKYPITSMTHTRFL
jgi:hypothetical protein